MGMAVAIQAGLACLGAGEVDHERRRRTKGSRCSWATGRCGQREAQGHAVVWHTEAEEEKGKGGGVRLSARGSTRERGGGPAAWRRVEEESVGGGGAGGRRRRWPVSVCHVKQGSGRRAWAGRGK
jgi:hypothetical protein